MSSEKPCLPGCRRLLIGDGRSDFWARTGYETAHAPNCPNAEPAPAPCDHAWGDPQNRDGTLKTCQKCGIGGAPAPGYVAPVSIPGSADQEWDKSAPKVWQCKNCGATVLHNYMHWVAKTGGGEQSFCPRCKHAGSMFAVKRRLKQLAAVLTKGDK